MLFVWLWIGFFGFFGYFFFHFTIHVSSLSAMPLHSQDFCLCYWVTQSVSHYVKKKSVPQCLFLIFWMQLQRFLCGIMNQLVKAVCFVKIWGLQKQWRKRMKNLSRVFLDKHSKKKKNTWRNLKRLSFKTQFKIEFLLPFTGCRKVLG